MSNEIKWTPGEWRVNPKAKTHIECDDHGIASTGSWAARSMDSLDIEVEQRANANLIAAAPEMYEALKRVQQEGGMGIGLHRQIDRVMAKARGEQ